MCDPWIGLLISSSEGRLSRSKPRPPGSEESRLSPLPGGAVRWPRLFPGSMEEPDPEAEYLVPILRRLDDREAKVQGDRHRAQHRDHDPHAHARRHPIVLDLDIPLDRAGIDER